MKILKHLNMKIFKLLTIFKLRVRYEDIKAPEHEDI